MDMLLLAATLKHAIASAFIGVAAFISSLFGDAPAEAPAQD
jgi:hypothetical protein